MKDKAVIDTLSAVILGTLAEVIGEDELENSGDCEINGHELAAFISPQKVGTYRFKYIYEIAGETWVDNVKIKAG